MIRTLLVLCVAAVASGSFLDRLRGKHHSYEKKPQMKVCNAGQDLFQVNPSLGLTVTPYPPRSGETFTVDLHGYVKQRLENIRLSVNVHYGLIPLADTTVDVCGELHCPIPQGPFEMKKEVKLPGAAPSGHYRISVKGHNLKNQEIICASIDVYIK
eukprot:TRINITY_DN767_c0_g1_i2.p1 TRINITY_DN767_c0_g1~~TRINITY_DN767_c0_g1_i2.p1  ORF type:complete len:174 (+),score=71.15 TRINITY_DN767_c0_g1_i2:56-523(+)